MENTNSFYNLVHNLSAKQKIAIALFIAILIIGGIFAGLGNTTKNPLQADTSEEQSLTTASSSSNIDSSSNESPADGYTPTGFPISTEYNSNHNYTLIEYLPYSDDVFLTGEESMEDVIENFIIKENTAISKGIVVSVDSCDVEGNTAAANNYLASIPVDLSQYDIVYQTHVGDVPCESR